MGDLAQHLRSEGPALYRIAWRIVGNAHDVDDILQEVAVEAISLADRESIQDWVAILKRLTVCRSIDCLRRRRPKEPFSDSHYAPKQPTPMDEAIREDLENQLRLALGELPARQAEVFSMRYFDNQGNSEIAATLDISTAAVATALRKARLKLAERLSVERMRVSSDENQ